MIIVLSFDFVNKNDDLFTNSQFIQDIDGFETFVSHGSEDYIYWYDNDGNEYCYTAKNIKEILEKSSSYRGGNIKLVSCNTGAKKDGIAQQLANELGVKVLAPTEAVYVNEKGNMFITNNQILAELWYDGQKVKETGEWRLFVPGVIAYEEFNSVSRVW